ncbi:MAG: orotidine-5'-phosphate decarboxylase [Myxococcales bacterium]|nr:orotidine-5'-phosphate decarboxylase [Myxococcales bacterium]
MTTDAVEAIRRKLILALDFPYVQEAIGMIHKVRPEVMHYKVGLELWSSTGGDLFHYFNEEELDFFVDLKLHDIPNTVAQAVKKIMAHKPSLMTIHAMGGMDMMRAAADAKNGHEHAAHSKVVAVTVLTHHHDSDLPKLGMSGSAADQVKRLANLAQESGLDGVVCSAQEAATLRAQCGDDFTLVCPGIRPAGSQAHDQARIMTPKAAIAAGADYLVVGRPIRQAEDPQAVAKALLKEMAE